MQVSKTPKKFHQKIFVVKPAVKVFHSSHPSCQRRKIFSKRQCVLEPSKLKYKLYKTQSKTNQNTPMNTITTMNTNFVTLFFAFTRSLQQISPHDSEHYYQIHSFLLIFLNLPFTTNDVDLVTIKISKGFFTLKLQSWLSSTEKLA